MARIRTIKPEFFRSPSTARASFKARILFQAMWCWADDYGIGETNEYGLLGLAFCDEDQIDRKELQCLLSEVQNAYDVTFYTVENRHYFAIPSWDDHQKTQRRANRRNPTPDDPRATLDQRFYKDAGKQGVSERTQGTSVHPQGTSVLGTGEPGNRGTGEQNPSALRTTRAAAPVAEPVDALFDAEPEPEPEPAPKPKRTAAKRSTPDSPEHKIAEAVYVRTNKALEFIKVRSVAKWAVHTRGENPVNVENAIVGVHELGRPVLNSTVGQWLDGHIGPAGQRSGPSKQDSKIASYLETGRELADRLAAQQAAATTHHTFDPFGELEA